MADPCSWDAVRETRGGASFELAALDVPGALPVEIRGRFEGEGLRFDQAVSGVRRRPSPTPTPGGDATR